MHPLLLCLCSLSSPLTSKITGLFPSTSASHSLSRGVALESAFRLRHPFSWWRCYHALYKVNLLSSKCTRLPPNQNTLLYAVPSVLQVFHPPLIERMWRMDLFSKGEGSWKKTQLLFGVEWQPLFPTAINTQYSFGMCFDWMYNGKMFKNHCLPELLF